ncbi:putative protein phosphatase 2C 65 isoform X1 [Iris pallida]|uniref:protein-serine/threonine phosphatase n=1 Tax=Iris pallida TaxID=29817 RepID=A0AAX6HMK8_IRIPA|nr:putative protein phosphatase 2C 65 isoform X1 [Iris pallida]
MGCPQSKPYWCCCCSRAATNPSGPTKPAAAEADARHVLTGCTVGSVAVPSSGLTLRYSSLTQRGYYPDSPDRLNQDKFAVRTALRSDPDLHLFAVFDGHGQFGSECADFVKETLTQALLSEPDLPENPPKAFASAFDATNSLLRSSPIDDSMSGTTAIAVLVRRNSLFVANVGDSRAVAGVLEGDAVVAAELSKDQTPFRKDEYERVRQCGARVLSVDQVEGNKDPEVQSWGDEEDDDGDPPRLWVRDGLYPGTAFTRSLGDSTAEAIGVIAVPEVMEVEITPEHLFFVVASDGVFEFLSSQAVVNMVASFKDPRDACAAIAAESYKLWLEHENRTDDITIIIVHINDSCNPGAVAINEISNIDPKISVAVSEKAQAEKYVCKSSGTSNQLNSNSELQSCPDLALERSPACVAPSPERTSPKK